MWYYLLCILIGFLMGFAYKWLEIHNLQIQLFIQSNEIYILEQALKKYD